MDQWSYISTKDQTHNGSLEKGFSTQEGSQDVQRYSNAGIAQSNATTAKRSLTTKPTNATKQRYVVSAPKKAITIANVRRLSSNVSYAEAPTNRLAETVGNSIYLSMSRTFRLIQLNVRKQDVVLDSLMNDEQIQDATILAI